MTPVMKYPDRQYRERDMKQICSCQKLGEGRMGDPSLVSMGFPFGVMKMFWI